MFIGREKELQELEARYSDPHPQLIVVYGKRRLGKTALLKEFAKGKTHLFYVSRETIDSEQIKLFSEEILSDNPVKEFISSFDSWEKAFLFLVNESKSKKLLLIIDEFPYIAQNNKEILSILQKIWDSQNPDNAFMVVLTGSSLAYMEEDLLGQNSPLYGRTTATIKLDALPFQDARKILTSASVADQIAYYSILGGIPRYLRSLDPEKNFEENLKKYLLNKFSFLYQEVGLLMREELREPSTYYAILSAIAAGNNTIKDIALATGLDKTKINVYLKNLMQLNILYKKIPLLLPQEKANQHRSMYLFKEPYFRFYFNFLVPNLSLLEKLTVEEFYLAKVKPFLHQFIEEECQNIGIELLLEKNSKSNLDQNYQQIGNTWNEKVRLDIFGFASSGSMLSGSFFYNRLPSLEDIDGVRQCTTLYTKDPSIKASYYFIVNLPLNEELQQLEALDKTIHFIIVQ